MLESDMPRPRKHRPPLTKRTIDAAKPDPKLRKAGGKDRFLWDGQEHGLGVKITPAPHGSKVFIYQKSVQGRLKRITLGHHGDLTLDMARNRARHLNGEISNGRDPVAEAKAMREEREHREQSEQTVSDLWKRYSAEIVSVENRPSTATEKQRMWKSRIKPKLGKLKIKDVTDQIAGALVHEAFQLGANGRVVAGRGAAGNLYRLLHHMFSKALAWGMRPRNLGNPLENVAEPRVKRRERLLTSSEIGALLKELDHSAVEKLEPSVVIAAVRTAILTGARISEILTLRWGDVRADEMELHLRDTKTGFSRRPIPAEALAVIQGVEHMPGAPFVFRSPKKPSQPIYYSTVRKAFQRITERAGVPNCTLHTVRHWFSTMTANSVSNPRVGMALTGHRSHAAYMNYIHSDRAQVRELADQLGAFTTSLAGGENVVPLRKSEG